MKKSVILTQREFDDIKAYAEFIRANESPCDRKCGPKGSPDRRACCGCPEQTAYVNQVRNFCKEHLISEETLRDPDVKALIKSHQDLAEAEGTLKAAEERLAIAKRSLKKISERFVIDD